MLTPNQKKLPDFIIVGAAKSGTTSLYYYLNAFDEIFMSKVKEPHFFSFYQDEPNFQSPEKLNNVVHNLSEYHALFDAAAEDQILGEASTSYLYFHKKAINNINKVYGEDYRKIKIIIALRNPVERAWSQINHFKKFDHEPLKPIEAVKQERITHRMKNKWNNFYDYLGFGYYYEQVKSYLDHFDKVHVFTYFELKENRIATVNEVVNFILDTEKDYSEILEGLNKKYNISGVPKNKLSQVIWNITHRQNPIKKLAAILVPEKIKKYFYNKVSSKILKSNEMPNHFVEEVKDVFESQIKPLEELIDKDLNKWKY